MQPGPVEDLKPGHREPKSVSPVGNGQLPAMPDEGCARSDSETNPAATKRKQLYRKGEAHNAKSDHRAESSRHPIKAGSGKFSRLCRSWHGEDRKSLDKTTEPVTITERTALVPNGLVSNTTQRRAARTRRLESPVRNGAGNDEDNDIGDDGGGFGQCPDQPPGPVAKKDGVSESGVVDDEQRKRLRFRLTVWMLLSLVCYVTAMLSVMPVLSQYIFMRTAMDHFNLTNVTSHKPPCAEGQNDSLQKDLNWVQGQASTRLMGMEFCQFLPAIFVALLVGSYADYFGRKALVLSPIIGAFLKSLVVFLVIYLEADLDYLFLGSALEGLMGSFYVLELGLFAAIADVTISSRQRVLLFASMEISLAISGAVSQIGTGFLIDALGFVAPSIMVACLFLLAAAFILFFVPETLHSRPPRLILNPLVHLRKVFGFYFWDGSVSQRLLFLCGQLVLFLATMVNLGRMGIETLYVLNSPLCWGALHIGVYSGLKLLLQNLLGVLALKMLSKCLRIEMIGMLGLLSAMSGFAIQAFAREDAIMYLSAGVGLLFSVVSPVIRTLLSRMVPATSQGALFASLAAVETVCHLTASIIYNSVYTATLDTFPGTVFMLMAAILFADLCLLMLFTVMSRKFPELQEVQVEPPSPDGDAALPPPKPPATSSSSSSSSSKPREDETTPLLFNTSDRCRKNMSRMSTSV